MYIFSSMSTIDLRSRRVLSPRHLQTLPEPNEPRSPEDYVLRTPECYGPFHQGPCATELLRREVAPFKEEKKKKGKRKKVKADGCNETKSPTWPEQGVRTQLQKDQTGSPQLIRRCNLLAVGRWL